MLPAERFCERVSIYGITVNFVGCAASLSICVGVLNAVNKHVDQCELRCWLLVSFSSENVWYCLFLRIVVHQGSCVRMSDCC